MGLREWHRHTLLGWCIRVQYFQHIDFPVDLLDLGFMISIKSMIDLIEIMILKFRGRRGWTECGDVTLNAGGEEKVVEKRWQLVEIGGSQWLSSGDNDSPVETMTLQRRQWLSSGDNDSPMETMTLQWIQWLSRVGAPLVGAPEWVLQSGRTRVGVPEWVHQSGCTRVGAPEWVHQSGCTTGGRTHWWKGERRWKSGQMKRKEVEKVSPSHSSPNGLPTDSWVALWNTRSWARCNCPWSDVSKLELWRRDTENSLFLGSTALGCSTLCDHHPSPAHNKLLLCWRQPIYLATFIRSGSRLGIGVNITPSLELSLS